MIQNQLRRMERDSLPESSKVGTVRLYSFNPLFPLLAELRRLLHRRLDLMDASEFEQLFN